MTVKTSKFFGLNKAKYYIGAWLRTGVVGRFVWGVPEIEQTANITIMDAVGIIEGTVAERIRLSREYTKRAKRNLLKDLKQACLIARGGDL